MCLIVKVVLTKKSLFLCLCDTRLAAVCVLCKCIFPPHYSCAISLYHESKVFIILVTLSHLGTCE